ncbi:MAG TPA: nucleoside triphosphate pyrophosphohydrolase [Acidimicrobiia bacterium]|nr:nucleoside triphosphate pyrophosphohydrolase [Acidimicrobiia bacterium]
MAGRIVVVGLGPAGVDLMVAAARSALEEIPNRYTRTLRHPAVDDLAAAGVELRSFDHEYDRAGDVDDVYERIATELLDRAASTGEVLYAVPGNPAVAERSVELLREAAARGEVLLDIVPGLSFAELAWARLGVDPMRGGRLADARNLTAEDVGDAGPLLVAQCDTRLLLSDVKLVLLEVLPADALVTVLQRLGREDEEVRTVALTEVDRAVEPDHLTALLVDSDVSAAARELARLLGLAERLRGPGGCPWDADQTHHSLTRYLLEEAYEVVESVEALPPDAPAGDVPAGVYGHLEDELGDLLYQVIFHAVLAEEAGAFDMADVARRIHDKLVRRHPHVFGDTDAATSSDVMRNWEQIKKEEKGVSSIVAGITPGLPSLLYAHKLMRKAASVGLDPGGRDEALGRLDAALADLRAGGGRDLETELGELLAAAIVLARSGGVDAESALRGWAVRFRRRFEAMERRAASERIELAALPPDAVVALWAESGGER